MMDHIAKNINAQIKKIRSGTVLLRSKISLFFITTVPLLPYSTSDQMLVTSFLTSKHSG